MRRSRMVINSINGQKVLNGYGLRALPRPIPFPMQRDDNNDPSSGPLPKGPKKAPDADLPTQGKSGTGVSRKRGRKAFL